MIQVFQDCVGAPVSELIFNLLSGPNPRPTGIFCAQDGIAEEVIAIANELGIRVPQDLSVVGFDDISRAASFSPPLTTIRQPMREIGFRSAELLCERIENPAGIPRDIYFDVHLIERSSTAPPPGGI